jgi:predicted transcriptional regulator
VRVAHPFAILSNIGPDTAGPGCPIFRVLGRWDSTVVAIWGFYTVPFQLQQALFFRTLTMMEVHFTPEQQAQIAQIATKAGTVPERLVANVVVHYLGEEGRFLAAVEKGLAAATRGEFIEEEEMDARLEAMFKR